jgi:hypothetical protein
VAGLVPATAIGLLLSGAAGRVGLPAETTAAMMRAIVAKTPIGWCIMTSCGSCSPSGSFSAAARAALTSAMKRSASFFGGAHAVLHIAPESVEIELHAYNRWLFGIQPVSQHAQLRRHA